MNQAAEATVEIDVIGNGHTGRESMLFQETPSGDLPCVQISDVAFRVCREIAASAKRVRFFSFTDGDKENLRCDEALILQELRDWIGFLARSLDRRGGGRIEVHTSIRPSHAEISSDSRTGSADTQ